MPLPSGLQALVFDAYGTLFDVHSVARKCESLWPGRGAALSAAWRTKQLEYSWLRTLMGRYRPFSQVTREALAHACEALGLPLSSEIEEALLQEYRRLSLFPDVLPAFQKLKTIKKAILSNGSPDMLEPLVAGSGLRFDAVLSVDSLKLYKPAPEVYRLAVDRLGAAKQAIGFVSSNCWDALGASAFGLRVFWINRARSPLDRLELSPERTISSLAELA